MGIILQKKVAVPKGSDDSEGRGKVEVKYINSRRRKIVAWSAMALIFLAIVSLILIVIFYPRPISFPEPKQQEIEVQTQSIGASVLAERFAVAWLQGDLETANKQTAEGFEIKEEDITIPEGLEVRYRQAIDTFSQGNGKESVIVEVYLEPKKGDMFRIYVSVPVLVKDGSYGVYDYPALVQAPSRPSIPEESLAESSMDEEEKSIIKTRIQSFFRAYTEDRLEDVKFMYVDEKNAPKEALPGTTFKDIEDIEVIEKNKGEVLVRTLVVLTVADIELKQRYQFWMKRQNKEWKIDRTLPKNL